MTRDTISRFNRDTFWLATGILGIVIFAALVLATREHQPNATPADQDLLLNANPARVSSAIAIGSDVSTGMNPGPGSNVDHEFDETPLQETPLRETISTQTEPANR